MMCASGDHERGGVGFETSAPASGDFRLANRCVRLQIAHDLDAIFARSHADEGVPIFGALHADPRGGLQDPRKEPARECIPSHIPRIDAPVDDEQWNAELPGCAKEVGPDLGFDDDHRLRRHPLQPLPHGPAPVPRQVRHRLDCRTDSTERFSRGAALAVAG